MRRGLLLLVLGSVWIAPGALAQDRSALPPGAVVQPLDEGAGVELRRNLTLLAQNPQSVSALNGAGAAALATGDADAALNFFTRAADADPANARAKAGMAQALVRMERAREAMQLFAEAVRLGAPEAEIAGDRGLAWDTLGNPARAQADYALSLRRADDPEIRRRLALSLAITGRRDEALRMIQPQLRAHDRAGWRTQAFILALTGDAAGAGRTARTMMPGGADALAPFLQRLASLSPQQKALAVHFGHFPSDGRAQRFAQADNGADPGALAMAQGRVPMGAAAPRRRPDSDQSQLSAQIRPAPSRRSEAAPRRQYSAPSFAETGSSPAATGEGGPPSQRYAAATQSSGPVPAWPTPVLDERQSNYPSRATTPPPVPRPSPEPAPRQDNNQSPGFTFVPQGRPFGNPPEAAAERPEPPLADFSIVTSAVNSLEDEGGRARPVPAPARTEPARTARAAETRSTPRSSSRNARSRQTPAQANPSRVWVQVATGSNRAALIFTFGRFRERAPTLLNSRAAYVTPWNATNRLLVGPFPNEAAAASFVRQLGAHGVQSYSWTSDAGQRIDQLQAAASNDSRSSARSRTAADESSGSGSRNARGRSGSRTERAAAGATRSRNGAAGSRSGTSRTAGNSRRSAAGTSRSGRSGAGSTASGHGSRDPANAGRSATRGQKPASGAAARTSRRNTSSQSRSSTRRGR